MADATLWASLPMPVFRIDPADRLVDANPAGELFLNASVKVMQGQPVWDRLAVDAPLERGMARVRSSGAPLYVSDVDIGTGDRTPVLCNLQVAPLQGTDNVLLIVSPRELSGRATQSHSVSSAARSAIGMAQMLAHEIKNPLAGITGAAQLLSMNLDAQDLELTDLIVTETRRIVSLLDQVEQFGNLQPPRLRPVNLHDLLDRARRSALVGFASHMTIVEEYDPSLPEAHADPDQLLQVFLNLLKNAAEAAGEDGGTIRLRTFYEHAFRLRRGDGQGQALPLQIEVIDDGPGLPPNIRDDVFDPFVSGRENGTGLGLALTAKILGDHGGWITVDSGPGRTAFRMSLARAPDVDVAVKES